MINVDFTCFVYNFNIYLDVKKSNFCAIFILYLFMPIFAIVHGYLLDSIEIHRNQSF